MLPRRQFATSCFGACLLPKLAFAQAPKKKIAFLGTSVYQHSHAQHFLDRFAAGYAMGGKWNAPAVEIAGVYIEQTPEKDISKQRIAKYGLRQFTSIADTLTLGGDKLAVDGVILIGEHGDYPSNEKGQKLYPRYRWFQEIIKIFESSGRSVPVFNDKHLSTDWHECQTMVENAKRLGFPFFAGSSLPVTWRLPSFELEIDTPLQESVCVAYGGVDSYDFHALETAQCISERRRGGEVGIRSVQALKGEPMWEELAKREMTQRLFISALCRSHHLPVETGYPTAPISFEWARQALSNTTGYFIEHRDGFQTSIFLTGIRDFNYAGFRSDTNEIIGCQMMLPMPGSSATTADFFNPLTQHVEQMIVSGQTEYPIERTLLTSGMVIAAVDSIFAGGTRRDTPEMAVEYRAPKASMYWQK